MLEAMGCACYVFSESRATRITPGIPDVLFFLPNGRGMAWWEAKTIDGVVSEAQFGFEEHCLRCGQPYVRGGLPELTAFLRGLGIIAP